MADLVEAGVVQPPPSEPPAPAPAPAMPTLPQPPPILTPLSGSSTDGLPSTTTVPNALPAEMEALFAELANLTTNQFAALPPPPAAEGMWSTTTTHPAFPTATSIPTTTIPPPLPPPPATDPWAAPAADPWAAQAGPPHLPAFFQTDPNTQAFFGPSGGGALDFLLEDEEEPVALEEPAPPPPAPPPAAAGAPPPTSSKQALLASLAAKQSKSSNSNSPAAARRSAASDTVVPPQTKPLIVIDGPNVAIKHGQRVRFSSRGIQLVIQYWQEQGHRALAFVPEKHLDERGVGLNKRAASLGLSDPKHVADDVPLLRALEAKGELVVTPAQDHDDSYCIDYARRHAPACIVSNDMYRDSTLVNKQWRTAHLISYTFLQDEFLPNPEFVFPVN